MRSAERLEDSICATCCCGWAKDKPKRTAKSHALHQGTFDSTDSQTSSLQVHQAAELVHFWKKHFRAQGNVPLMTRDTHKTIYDYHVKMVMGICVKRTFRFRRFFIACQDAQGSFWPSCLRQKPQSPGILWNAESSVLPAQSQAKDLQYSGCLVLFKTFKCWEGQSLDSLLISSNLLVHETSNHATAQYKKEETIALPLHERRKNVHRVTLFTLTPMFKR